MSGIEKRLNTYYSNFTFRGKRYRQSLGTSDEETAQRRCDELRAELWQRETTPVSSTFGDAVNLWLASGDKDASDRYRIRAFNLWDKPLENITSETLEPILSKYTGSTRNRCINLLTAILNCAVRRGWIKRVPDMQRVKVKSSRTRWLTYNEWERLEAELAGNLKQMARFAVTTGLRENNVIELEWSQVDLQRKVAWIHPDQAKGKKAIGIPLSAKAIEVLREQLGKHERFVFVYRADDGRPWHKVTKASTRSWKMALVRAGIDVVPTGKKSATGQERFTSTFRWHDLRHTWASWHIMNGTPLEVLQKLGGWKSLAMVMRYAHLAPEYLANFADNMANKKEVVQASG